MWTLFLALFAAVWIGRAIRDPLSALFLAAIVGWALRHAADQAHALFAGARLLRPLAAALGEEARVEALPLVLLALAAAALANVLSRPTDRLKHWDDLGPRKGRLRKRAHA